MDPTDLANLCGKERKRDGGTVHPDVLHSFVHDRRLADREPREMPIEEDLDDLPDFDVFVQHEGDQHYPAHWHPGTGEFGIGHHDAHEMLASREIVANHPPDAVLPSSYEAVH